MDRIDRFKKFFLSFLSFDNPKTIVFNLTSILVILAVVPTKYLVYSPVKCIFRNVILPLIFRGSCPLTGFFAGCQCPACGMTRAMSRLLHGDVIGAWYFNRGVFLVLVVMIILIGVNVVKIIQKRKV